MSFRGSEAGGTGSAGRGALPMIRKNAATTLFQNTSSTPITLAMPEVTVITWSGPAYSAKNSKCMKLRWQFCKIYYCNLTGVTSRSRIKILLLEPTITLADLAGTAIAR